jgi:hypothetical protein
MQNLNRHHIFSCHFEIDFYSQKKALEYQNRLVRLIREKLLDEAEYLFDNLPIKKEMLLIERLEVNLGEITLSQLESSGHHFFRRKLEEAIMRLLQDAEEGKTEGVDFVPLTVSKMDLLIHFLLTGQLKWWAESRQQNGIVLKELWEELKKSAPTQFIEEISDLFRDSTALQRFLYHFDEEDVYNLIDFLLPANKQLLKATIEHHKPLKVFFQDNDKQLKYLQLRFAVPYFLNLRRQLAQPYQFLSDLYTFLATETQLTVPTILGVLPKIKDKASPIYEAKREIDEVFESLSVKVKHQKKEEESIYPENALQLWKEFLEKGVFVSKKISLKEGLSIVWMLLNKHWKNEIVNVLRNYWHQSSTKKTLLQHFQVKQLEVLLRLIVPQKADFVLSIHKRLNQKGSIQNLTYKILWESSLHYALIEKKTTFNEQEYVKSLITQLSRKTNNRVGDLIPVFYSLDNIEQITNPNWQELIQNLENELEKDIELVNQFTLKLTIEEKLEAFRYFLEKGYFPQNIQAAMNRQEAELIIWELFEEKSEEVALLLIEVNLINNPQLLNKISQQFSSELSKVLLNEIMSSENDEEYYRYLFKTQIQEKEWFFDYFQSLFSSYELKLEEVQEMFEELFKNSPEQITNILTQLQIADDTHLTQNRQEFVKKFAKLVLEKTKYAQILPQIALNLNNSQNLLEQLNKIQFEDTQKEQENTQNILSLTQKLPIETLINILDTFLLTRKFPTAVEFTLNELVLYLKEHHEIETLAYLKKLLPQKQKTLLNELSVELREYILLLSKQNLPLSLYKYELVKYFKFNESINSLLNIQKIEHEKNLSVQQYILLLQEWIENSPKEIYEILKLSIKEESLIEYWVKILPISMLKQFVQILLPQKYTTLISNVEKLWKGLIQSEAVEVYQKIDEKKKYELLLGYIHQYPSGYNTQSLIEYFIQFSEENLKMTDKKSVLKTFEYVEMDEDLESSIINVVQKFGQELDQEILQKELLQKRDEQILKEKRVSSDKSKEEQLITLEKMYQELKNKLSDIQSREEEAISQLENLLSMTNPYDTKNIERLKKEIQEAKLRKDDKINKIEKTISQIEEKIKNITNKVQELENESLDKYELSNTKIKKEINSIEQELEKLRLQYANVSSSVERDTYFQITNTLIKKLESLKRELNVRYSLKEDKHLIEDEIAQTKVRIEENEKNIEKILEMLSEYDNILNQITLIESNILDTEKTIELSEIEVQTIQKEIESVQKIVSTLDIKEQLLKENLLTFEKLKSELLQLEKHSNNLNNDNLNKEINEDVKNKLIEINNQMRLIRNEKNEIEKILTKLQKEVAEARAMKQYQNNLEVELKPKKQQYQLLLIEVKERKNKITALRQRIEELEKLAEEYQESLDEKDNLKNFLAQKEKELQELEKILEQEKLEEQLLNQKAEQMLKETKRKRIEQLRRPKSTAQQQKAELEPKFVNNAGLVIVHPFIMRLFRMLKLVKGIAFIDEASQHRGVHILQYVAYKSQKTPEYELMLNKILCGIPPELPIEIDIELTEEEKNLCESMIHGVVQNWSILKNTSNDNFRVSFVHREGKIVPEKIGGWRMKVERKALDVLMEKLTWEIKTIRLPWMDKPLYVDW